MIEDHSSGTTSAIVPPYPLPFEAIERRDGLSPEVFQERYESGMRRPVVVTDAMQEWPAWGKWGFDFFAKQYGEERVVVTNRLSGATAARRIKMGDFITYCQFPAFSPLSKNETDTPFYLTSFSPFVDHPELYGDFEDPYFLSNLYRSLEGPLGDWYKQGFGWIFIGPAGTLSPLHLDLFGTHAWLAQFHGRKRFLLFPKTDFPYVYDGRPDFINPDLKAFPDLAKTRPVLAILEPGEVIYIPEGWAHHVVSLDPSISLTFNFVDASNAVDHVMAITRDLPNWVNKTGTDSFKQANRVYWTQAEFSFPGQDDNNGKEEGSH